MNSFDTLWRRAASRCGGTQALERLLSDVSNQNDLPLKRNNQCLALLTQCIFETGFNPNVVQHKWPGFLDAFLDFEPHELLALPEQNWDALERDPRIIRNPAKGRL
ncbi:MAG: hypothetical protein GKR94_24180 [Gammaproteobacteria bacterium]|nr:hypothetical protein [Gammaproteobacteria bacterium]